MVASLKCASRHRTHSHQNPSRAERVGFWDNALLPGCRRQAAPRMCSVPGLGAERVQVRCSLITHPGQDAVCTTDAAGTKTLGIRGWGATVSCRTPGSVRPRDMLRKPPQPQPISPARNPCWIASRCFLSTDRVLASGCCLLGQVSRRLQSKGRLLTGCNL